MRMAPLLPDATLFRSGGGLLAEPRRYVTRIDGEQRRVVVDLAGSAPVDRMQSHGLGEVHADMLERDREAAVAIERELLAEAQLAVGVVVDLLDDVGVGARRLPVGSGGRRGGVLLAPVVKARFGGRPGEH